MLNHAIEQERALHLPGVRERYRRQLEDAITLANQALGATDKPAAVAAAHRTLVKAHAARAEDARYGAGQLSRGAQRAPTRQDCDDGWQRVEAIVANAEASAQQARHLANELDEPAADRIAIKAEVAASKARQIVDERNHAYTFHTNPGFSFGEGWYIAASALLAGVTIQIEPDGPQASQAEQFLRDAGLGACLATYRSRPRTNKQLTAIVADAFRAGPLSAQRTLRAAFLGAAPPAPSIAEWTHRKIGALSGKKVLLWIRHGVHDSERNTAYPELVELTRCVLAAGLVPVLFGDAIQGGSAPLGAADLTLAWREPRFQGLDMRRAQLQLFEEMRCHHGLAGQLGVTTAGMDGPALLGLPTLYLTEAPNVRMRRWVGVIPGYQEVARGPDYLETIRDTLLLWKAHEGARPPGASASAEGASG